MIVPLTDVLVSLTIAVELPDVALPVPLVTFPGSGGASTVIHTLYVSLLDTLPLTAYISVRPAWRAVKATTEPVELLRVQTPDGVVYHANTRSSIESPLLSNPVALKFPDSVIFTVIDTGVTLMR